MLKVVAAAIIMDNRIWHLPPPNRHSNVIHAVVEKLGKRFINAGPDAQGFMISDGTYATRAKAYEIAVAADQLLKDDPRVPYVPGELFSEDVW